MFLRQLNLQQFRNVALVTLPLRGRQQFFVGANGQGKTNLLEAVGFLTALRSFRTTDNRVLIAHGQKEAAIACELDHEQLGDTRVTIKLRPDEKEVWSDQTRVTRLSDHVGRFPTVVFSSQDIQLVRGAPAVRRRWLDLTLAAMDAGYLRLLQAFTRALAERNALLKGGKATAAEFDAFEAALAPPAAALIAAREEGLRGLSESMQAAYLKLADAAETAELSYEPNVAAVTAEAFRARLAAGRARDAQFRSTLIGPHRDDLAIKVRGMPAREFASEGQQRSAVLALRLAQAAWFQTRSGTRPVMLADDVLGELDQNRRRRFWAAIDPEAQVIATGTSLPDASLGDWQVFQVSAGTVEAAGPPAVHQDSPEAGEG